MVASVSDDASIADDEAGRDGVRERVRETGGYAHVVYAADKVSKVRELRMLLPTGVDPDLASVKLMRHQKSLAMLEQVIRAVAWWSSSASLKARVQLPPQTDNPAPTGDSVGGHRALCLASPSGG